MVGSGRIEGSAPSAVAELLAQARQGLDRVAPEALDEERAAGALVVDIRPEANRQSEGCLPGSVVIDRNVLEWRLDPTSADRLDVVTDADLPIVIACQEGYASTLAVASLERIGLTHVVDLAGGFVAWRDAGLPVVVPWPRVDLDTTSGVDSRAATASA
jgi:rhodanese-related sulfurtransferase